MIHRGFSAVVMNKMVETEGIFLFVTLADLILTFAIIRLERESYSGIVHFNS